jgi:limonene 1,2-monooxygenase
VMLGLGPGSLPSDGVMVGLSQSQTRGLLEDGLGVIMKLLKGDEPVTFKNDRWDLRDAQLHLRPYSNPLFDIAVPAVASPTGPKLAGMHGVGLLSIGATTAAGFDALALHWNVMEQQAAHFKTQVSRDKWRLVGLVHCAETMDQAYRDVEYGIEQWFEYFQAVAAFPQMAMPGNNVKEMISFVNDSGFGAIGTPDMVNKQISRLWQQSDGGFGAYLLLAHNWANFDATRKSYDLIARHVFPHWQGQLATQRSADLARAARPALADIHSKAVEAATQRFAAEVAARVH